MILKVCCSCELPTAAILRVTRSPLPVGAVCEACRVRETRSSTKGHKAFVVACEDTDLDRIHGSMYYPTGVRCLQGPKWRLDRGELGKDLTTFIATTC